jgi:hypothetical protein
MFSEALITASKVSIYTVPTDAPEADGTFAWDSTTMVLVQLEAAGKTGLGYTYADASAGKLIERTSFTARMLSHMQRWSRP